MRRIQLNLAHAGEKLAHHGKTVTAELAVRVPRSLAGESVRVEVEATDRNGRRQAEVLAGQIRLTR